MGYFPAEAPEVQLHRGGERTTTSGYYGNVVAGPIFREIADKGPPTGWNSSLTSHHVTKVRANPRLFSGERPRPPSPSPDCTCRWTLKGMPNGDHQVPPTRRW